MADMFYPYWVPVGLNSELSFKASEAVELCDLLWYDSANSAVRPASAFADSGTGPTQTYFAALFAGVANNKQRASDSTALRAHCLTDVVMEFPCASSTFAVGDYVEPTYSTDHLLNQQLTKTTVASRAIGRVVKLYASATTKVKVRLTSRLLGNPSTFSGGLGLGTEFGSPGASTAAAGSTTSDAGVLPAATARFYPTTAADDTKGVRIHADDKVLGRTLFIGNGVSNKILKVYAPSGGTINGAAADAAYSSASGKGVLIYCSSSSGNTWYAIG